VTRADRHRGCLGLVARRAAKDARGGRPPAFDRDAYEQRNVVERCFNRLKQWRDLASRYAIRASIHLPGQPAHHRHRHLAQMIDRTGP
jgi:transposase